MGLFLKGREVEGEIEEARTRWRFDCSLASSVSGPDGRIVMVSKLRSKSEG
jgi:16S rRNA (guanine527-N7)-methyltransferase